MQALFTKIAFVSIFALLNCACTVTIGQNDVFAPQLQNKRSIDAELTLDGEVAQKDIHFDHDRIEIDKSLSIAFTHLSLNIAKESSAPHSRTLIWLCMGNAADRKTDGLRYAKKLLGADRDVMIFDYPGYGDSSGEIDIDDFTRANQALTHHIANSDYDYIGLWGHSLGGFVCADIARQIIERSDVDLQAVIFETSATDIDELIASMTPLWAKPFIRFKIDPGLKAYDNVAAMNGFEGPIWVIGSSEDRQLPTELSERLAKGLRKEGHDVTLTIFDDVGHNNVSDHPNFTQKRDEFFRKTGL